MRLSRLACALVLPGVLVASAARAEPAAIDRLEVSERGSRFFVADSLDLDTRGVPFQLATGIATTYASRLRVYGNEREGQVTSLVENAFAIHPGAAIVLAPGARFSLDMPLVFETGEQTNLSRVAYFEPASPAPGDLRGAIDIRIFSTREVTTALGVRAWLPTGSASSYTSDGYTRVEAHAGTAVRVDWLLAAARIGGMVRRELEPFGSVSLGAEANATLAAGYQATMTGVLSDVVIGPELHASTILRDAFRHKATPVEAMLGAHLGFGDLRVGAGAGAGIVTGFGSSTVRGLFSIEWVPGTSRVATDRDGDGVMDADDACPDVAGPAASQGCPPPPSDRDGDGIIDDEDACPDKPGMPARTDDRATHGCPPLEPDREEAPLPPDAMPD